MTLPPERIPFPVDPSYSVRPVMRRFGAADAGHLRTDRRLPEYLDAKLRLLQSDPGGCRVIAPGADRGQLEAALRAAAAGLAADAGGAAAPIRLTERELRFPLLGLALRRSDLALVAVSAAPEALPAELRARAKAHLEGLEPLPRLADALALAVQEDLVVMAGAAAGQASEDGRAELLHVCFPSSWDPSERAGAGFRALHAPVPHGDVLAGAAGRVVRAMVTRGPFVRYVWSLAPDGALDQNPRRRRRDGRPAAAARAASARPSSPRPPSEAWFRVERQTVLPLPELKRALFTIRVYRTPLPEALSTPQRRRALAAALRSMDEALLAYKGVRQRDALLAFIEGSGPGATGQGG